MLNLLEILEKYWKMFRVGFALILLAVVLHLCAEIKQLIQDQRVDEAAVTLSTRFAGLDQGGRREALRVELMKLREHEIWRELLEHLAEALFLSGIMIVCVESFTHIAAETKEEERIRTLTALFRKRSKKLSRKTWQAVFSRLISSEIENEVVRLLKSNVCRLRPTYTITLSKHNYRNVPDGHIVVTRRLRYGLKNITGMPLKSYPINIKTRDTTVGDRELMDLHGHAVMLPRIRTVQIHHDSTVEIPRDRRRAWGTEKDLPVMNHDQDAWTVESVVEGLFLTTDRALYVLTQPCIGLEVTILNEVPELIEIERENIYVTSLVDLRRIGDNTWYTDTGMITGTALSVSWRKRPEQISSPAHSPELSA